MSYYIILTQRTILQLDVSWMLSLSFFLQFSLPASFRVGGTSLESNSEEIILQRVVSYAQSCSDDS